MRHPQAIEPVACNNTQKHPADSHCEAARANVIQGTDLAYLKTKSPNLTGVFVSPKPKLATTAQATRTRKALSYKHRYLSAR